MILTVFPSQSLKGIVNLPPSKSYSIRAFLIAACGNTSIIINPSNCDDAAVAMNIARQLGCVIKHDHHRRVIKANAQDKRMATFNVGESGTVLRFLLPLLALRGKRVKVIGEGTLKTRPNAFLISALKGMGCKIYGQGKKHTVPIVIEGGRLRCGEIRMDGSLSSQFISALLMACPLLEGDSRLIIEGKNVVSETYIVMTRQILKKAGIQIQVLSPKSFFIKGNQEYKGLKNFVVPSDYGLAAFLLAAGALIPSKIVLKGHLKDDLVQADGAMMGFLKRLGVGFEKTNARVSLQGPYDLKGGTFSLKDCPDLVPIMAVLSLFAKGKTTLRDISHARVKESNRISDLRKELQKVGAVIKERKGSMTLFPQPDYRKNIVLDPHHDHRLAMAFAILGLKLGVRIKDIECTAKSYPDFVSDLKKIGAHFSQS